MTALDWRPMYTARSTQLFAIALVLAFAFSGCGGDDTAPSTVDANGCRTAEQPAAKTVDVERPTTSLDADARNIATFKTNCGDFQVLLDAKRNPRTASSMAHLIQEGFYDGTWFHRIVPGFVIQGGDPAGDGTGGTGWSIVEPPTGPYRIGTVAMAKAANEPSGASSSQFYVVIGENGTDLPPDYAIAGRVVGGSDVIEKISRYAAPDDAQTDTPAGVALIEQATLTVDGE